MISIVLVISTCSNQSYFHILKKILCRIVYKEYHIESYVNILSNKIVYTVIFFTMRRQDTIAEKPYEDKSRQKRSRCNQSIQEMGHIVEDERHRSGVIAKR